MGDAIVEEMEKEFTTKNTTKGIGRSLLLFLGIIFAVFAAAIWWLGIIALTIPGFSIYQSSKDASKFKIPNPVIKIIFVVIAILFIMLGLLG